MGKEIDVFDEDDFDWGDGEDFSSPTSSTEVQNEQPVVNQQPRMRQNAAQRPKQQTTREWHDNSKPKQSKYDSVQGTPEMAVTETVGTSDAYTGGYGDVNAQKFKPERKHQQPVKGVQQEHIYTVDELKMMVNNHQITMEQAKNYMAQHGITPNNQNQQVQQNIQQPVQNLQQPVQTYTFEQLQEMVNNGQMTLDEAQAILNRQNEMAQNQDNKKKKSKLPFIIIGVVVIVIALIFVKSKFGKQEVVEDVFTFDSSTFDSFRDALNNYDATSIDALVGTGFGDSWIAQEWSYANLDADKEDFIKSACKSVSFTYPTNESESLQVTIPDYSKMSSDALADTEYIQKLYKSSGYSESDYTYYQEVYDLALYYIDQKYGEELPTTTVTCNLEVSGGLVVDDAELDDLLFGSDAWHDYLDSFQKSLTGWTGFKDEIYYETEKQLNPEYDEWFNIFIVYYQEDGGTYDEATDTFSGGHFSKSTSKWEPWFKRDENDPDKILVDENGEKIVNYYSVKKEDGTDWIQPDRYIEVEVEKTRQVDDPFVPESPIRYGYLGAHWITVNNCEYDTTIQVGDGTIEHPAGIGTTLITKLLGTDGRYHDVKVTLTGYWVGQDAIDYAVEFSDKNRGLVSNSVIQLICYEFRLENLEDNDFNFEAGEFCLMNSSSSKSSRTGTMYGFKQGGTLKAHQPELFNDWYTSTELEQKYLCWGSSFSRKYPVMYFMVLAGDGDVPSYSAYNQFTKVIESDYESLEETPVETNSVDSETEEGSETENSDDE